MKRGIGLRRKIFNGDYMLLILLLSVASIRKKLLKTTNTLIPKNVASIQTQKVAIFDSDR